MGKLMLNVAIMLICGVLQLQAQIPSILVRPNSGSSTEVPKPMDDNMRLAITTFASRLNDRGTPLLDFFAFAQKEENKKTAKNQKELIDNISISADAEVDIVIEMKCRETDGIKSVMIVLSAYENSSGNLVAQKNDTKYGNKSSSYGELIKKLLETMDEPFTNQLIDFFNGIMVNGRMVPVQFVFSPTSKTNFHAAVDKSGTELRDALENWIQKAACKGRYTILASTEKELVFDKVCVPLRHADTKAYYLPSELGEEIKQDLSSAGIKATTFLKRRNVIVVIE